MWSQTPPRPCLPTLPYIGGYTLHDILIHYKFRVTGRLFPIGEVVNNRSYALPDFSVEERREGDQADNTSRVVSVLNITSLSVTTHVRGGFSCVGSIGNPILERVVTRNVMNLRVQRKFETVGVQVAPLL